MNTLEIDARFNAVQQQRNTAQNEIVIMAGVIAVLNAKVAGLESQLQNYINKEEQAGKVAFPKLSSE